MAVGVTDYSTECGALPVSLVQMLASCIVGYHDISGVIHYRLNVIIVEGDCNDLHDFWTCDNNSIDPERALVENIFALDECGRLAVKIFSNQGSNPQ